MARGSRFDIEPEATSLRGRNRGYDATGAQQLAPTEPDGSAGGWLLGQAWYHPVRLIAGVAIGVLAWRKFTKGTR